MENKKIWLEAVLSGSYTKSVQSKIPMSISEIVSEGLSCAKAGASVLRVTAFNEKTGIIDSRAETYARIIEGIRTKVDAIVYPQAIPLKFDSSASKVKPLDRLAFAKKLAAEGLIEWISITPGSSNITHYDDLRNDNPGVISLNPEDHIRAGLELAKNYKLHPSFEILDPSSMRLGASLNWREESPVAVYRLVFSQGFPAGFPLEDYALTAHLNLLDQVAPGAPWIISGLDADIMPMIPRVIMEGGHISVGLGNEPMGTDKSNLQIVSEAAEAIKNSGGELASGEEIRDALGGIRKNPELLNPR